MSYCEEKLRIAEEVLNIAEKGFLERVHEIANDLSVCCSYKDAKAMFKCFSLAMEAMESVEDDLEYAKERYESEKENLL